MSYLYPNNPALSKPTKKTQSDNRGNSYIATDMNIDTRTNPDQTYYESILSRIPMGHWGKPEDFKGPIVFLASNASSYVSGETIVVRSYFDAICLDSFLIGN
jgi:NAD(P)-dependent dehydrogenase (short-subunit alcohol dehydrogenase family)